MKIDSKDALTVPGPVDTASSQALVVVPKTQQQSGNLAVVASGPMAPSDPVQAAAKALARMRERRITSEVLTRLCTTSDTIKALCAVMDEQFGPRPTYKPWSWFGLAPKPAKLFEDKQALFVLKTLHVTLVVNRDGLFAADRWRVARDHPGWPCYRALTQRELESLPELAVIEQRLSAMLGEVERIGQITEYFDEDELARNRGPNVKLAVKSTTPPEPTPGSVD